MDLRDRDGARRIKIYFKKAVDNRTLVQMRLEKILPEDFSDFQMPSFRVLGARSERGFLVLRGEIREAIRLAELN